MKHQRITAAHAPTCFCPRCRHVRAAELARVQRERVTAALCCAAGASGLLLIPGRVAIAFARHALGF